MTRPRNTPSLATPAHHHWLGLFTVTVWGLASALLVGWLMITSASYTADYPATPAAPAEASNVVYPFSAYPVQEMPSRCTKPAPSSPADYAAMFASLDTHQWGAADISLSVPLGDGRELWLYGDTFQSGRATLAHSTAIVQDDGCLHVSHGGAQLIPNDNAHSIYWITSAYNRSPFFGIKTFDQHTAALIEVTVRREILTGTCAWCFKDGGVTRDALVEVDYDTGGATFVDWDPFGEYLAAKGPTPAPKPISPMVVLGPHHFTYEHRVHTDITLPDGHHLVTDCQNWDDGVLHGFADYRPIFSESPA